MRDDQQGLAHRRSSHSIQLIINSQYLPKRRPQAQPRPPVVALDQEKISLLVFLWPPKTKNTHNQTDTGKKSLRVEVCVCVFPPAGMTISIFYDFLHNSAGHFAAVNSSLPVCIMTKAGYTFRIPYIVFSLWFWLACKRIEKKLMWNWTKPMAWPRDMQTGEMRKENAKGKLQWDENDELQLIN